MGGIGQNLGWQGALRIHETDRTMLRALALLLALLAPLASAEEAQQWLPVAGKVALLPGKRDGGSRTR